MKEKKTRKQIFEEKWLPKLKESNKVISVETKGTYCFIDSVKFGNIIYDTTTNMFTHNNIKPSDNGLKWLIKNLEL